MTDDKQLDKAADLLKAMAHPTRMRIMQLLSQHGELNVSRLMSALNLEQSLLSHHLTKMSDKRMLVSRRQGKEIWYSIADPVLGRVMQMAMK